jgi:hypothetical protein
MKNIISLLNKDGINVELNLKEETEKKFFYAI